MINSSWESSGRQKMGQVVELVKEDLAGVATGRARPALIESVRVEAYEGSSLTLKELATITAPDSQTLLVQAWDQSVVEKIAKAIQAAGLNLNPVIDQSVVRINIPSLTEDRRIELIKTIKQKVESGRAMLRQVRVDLKKAIDEQKNQPGVSEDDIRAGHEQLQQLVDDFHGQLDTLEQNKEKELLTI